VRWMKSSIFRWVNGSCERTTSAASDVAINGHFAAPIRLARRSRWPERGVPPLGVDGSASSTASSTPAAFEFDTVTGAPTYHCATRHASVPETPWRGLGRSGGPSGRGGVTLPLASGPSGPAEAVVVAVCRARRSCSQARSRVNRPCSPRRAPVVVPAPGARSHAELNRKCCTSCCTTSAVRSLPETLVACPMLGSSPALRVSRRGQIPCAFDSKLTPGSDRDRICYKADVRHGAGVARSDGWSKILARPLQLP
jgi:hypothetical protein